MTRQLTFRARGWRLELARATTVAAVATGPILLALRFLLPQFATKIGPVNADVRLVLTLLEWAAGRWAEGLRRFWDAPFFFPTPGTVALSDHLLLPSALYAVVRGLGGSPALGYNLLLVSSFSLTAGATYLLLRAAARTRPWLAAVLALAVVYAPWRWGQMVHLQMLWAPGPPLAILLFDRFLHRPGGGRAAAFLVAYAATLMSGCYLAYFTHAVFVANLAMRLGRATDRGRLALRWRTLVVTALLGTALGLAIFVPYVRENRVLHLKRKPAEMLHFGARPTDWLAPSSSNLYARAVPAHWRRPGASLFPGILLAAGTLGWLALGRRRRRKQAALPLLGGALLLSGAALALVAQGTVFARLAAWVPGLDGMRVPTRVQYFVLLALAVLAGRAVAARRPDRGSAAPRRWTALAVPALLLLDLYAAPIPAAWLFEPERAEDAPPHIRWLGAHDVRAIAFLPFVGGDVEVKRMWRTTLHHRPIANGHSGYLAPSYLFLRHECRTKTGVVSGRCVDALAALGVSHLVVEDSPRGPAAENVGARLSRALGTKTAPRLTLVFADSGALVLALRERAPGSEARPRARGHQRRDRPGREEP